MPPKRPYDDEDFDELDELEIYDEEDFELDEEDEYEKPKHHDDLGYLDGEDEDYEDDLERYVPMDDDEGMGPEDELPFMGATDE